MGSSILVWVLGILAPIYVLLAFFSYFPSFQPRLSAFWRLSFLVREFGGNLQKASGLRPESCFLPLVYHPLFPEIPDGRLPLVRGSFF